jgi:HSP20 family molecular chaperone IbpA
MSVKLKALKGGKMLFDDLVFGLYGTNYNLLTSLPTHYNKDTSEYTYEWEIPGYSKEEVAVRVSDSRFHFEAKNKQRGTVSRTLKFHVKMDASTAKATLQSGILTLKVKSRIKDEDFRALDLD